jgi:ATP-dependent RNA helicase RhlE
MTFYRPQRRRAQPHHSQSRPRSLESVPEVADTSPPPVPVPMEGPEIGSTSPFAALGLSAPLVKAVEHEGYERPTPIQVQAIPHVLAGKDLLGCAQTGTGKTAAFILPMLQRLARHAGNGRVRSLVLTPTRELAAQIGVATAAYGRHAHMRHTVIFGGVGQRPQETALRHRVDILVATPGRLMDLMRQGFVDLKGVEIFVLDEADRMLDMGFINDVRRIVNALPRVRQTLLFSATMPPEIATLASTILNEPVRVSVAPAVTTAETVDQQLYFVGKSDKPALLERLLRGPEITRALVFTRTKHGADRVFMHLSRAGVQASVIHGNKSQGARTKALDGFRAGGTRVLVATDIAARGIDVDGISHVINYDLPNVSESYVHRVGRTGRAGALGNAISFCDPLERDLLRDIERFIRRSIPVASGSAPPENVVRVPTRQDQRTPGGPGRRSFRAPRRSGGRR